MTWISYTHKHTHSVFLLGKKTLFTILLLLRLIAHNEPMKVKP